MSNPTIRLADGWRIRTHLGLDVTGYWWQWGYIPVILGGYEKSAQGYYGYQRVDMSQWIDRISKGSAIHVAPELMVKSAQDEVGQAFLYCEYRDGMSRYKSELRHYLLQGAAELINGHQTG
ncbi:hypothetical protein D477_003148 [Arthrobacter crystallopoietes BAB-32]|uniref:Uncharacterized protein n=2 Tax=Crystallibacter crystallopoietes TaxID=37928 RepID=N1VBI2_9MICC|nr:hypothetical protein D477_003148 [Arthrobacter crystallopoietes BAB-32]